MRSGISEVSKEACRFLSYFGGMKRCPCCSQSLPECSFNKNSSRLDGLQVNCKICQASYTKKHYNKDKTRYLERARRNHFSTKQKYDELLLGKKCFFCASVDDLRFAVKRGHTGKTLRQSITEGATEEQLKIICSSLVVVCKMCCSKYKGVSKYRGFNREVWVFKDSNKSDKKRGLSNDLDVAFVQQQISKPCMFCGDDKSMMTLDRIDNAKGHSKDNVQPACLRCNIVRGNMPYAAWLVVAQAMRIAREEGKFGEWYPWLKRPVKVPV